MAEPGVTPVMPQVSSSIGTRMALITEVLDQAAQHIMVWPDTQMRLNIQRQRVQAWSPPELVLQELLQQAAQRSSSLAVAVPTALVSTGSD